MAPAQQALETQELATVQGENRLVVDLELVPFQGPTEIGLQPPGFRCGNGYSSRR